jgi:hypothetical protein
MNDDDNIASSTDRLARLKNEREMVIEQRDTAIDAGFHEEVSRCDKEIELMDTTIAELESEIS